ncbi:hypothetical protein DB88DRAFT_491143 [Papiliotrema laurentii]|uniref:Uncharacterized protein n=1 Tax=Papiliotrema laurentii TaxID=5418 RepID=A0AAD9FPD0_PAPLA|nr:hypothetical protein DB88DRAFT_491143 [Papiliotrema laurentii]
MVKTGPGEGKLSLKVDFGGLEHVVSNIRSCVSSTSVFDPQAYKRSKDLVARLSCGRDSEDRLLSERDVAYSVLSGSCSGAAEQTAKAFEQLVDDIATWHEASRPGCPSDVLLGETLLQRVHTAAGKYCLFLTGIGSAVWRNRPGLREQTAAGLDPEVMARKLRAGELITSEEEKRIDEYLTDLASWRRWSSTVRSIQSSLAKLVIT